MAAGGCTGKLAGSMDGCTGATAGCCSETCGYVEVSGMSLKTGEVGVGKWRAVSTMLSELGSGRSGREVWVGSFEYAEKATACCWRCMSSKMWGWFWGAVCVEGGAVKVSE